MYFVSFQRNDTILKRHIIAKTLNQFVRYYYFVIWCY